ncbi:4a-hydroxytetrahydrobiopterin dehydratase [Marinobacter caseinilyticus]|uniref:4a-hydroxytetrahydrobiopterin dehydratase n=1 Tax=Marinobacter caseinilyticus TaxID=2692195 RepID=UPI001407620D|nr:4a-hydroxytetrahydrobiopterin dehydratase [Marinobacter caseinilyticus]
MDKLSELACEACRAGAPKVSDSEQNEWLPQLPGWAITEHKGEQQLERVYTFKNFAVALAFANKVGQLAESEGHHPAILVEYGKVTVNWWTHKIGGLHKNDFVMAARTDQLYE